MVLTDAVIGDLLAEVKSFVRLLDVTADLRDDVISDTLLIVLKRGAYVATLDPDDARRWVRGVAFLAARNSRRAELRRSAAVQRLREITPKLDRVGPGLEDGELASLLSSGLRVLPAADLALLVGQVWEGRTTAELATRSGLSAPAVRQRLSRARITVREEMLALASQFKQNIRSFIREPEPQNAPLGAGLNYS